MPGTSIIVVGRNGQLARELADLDWPVGMQLHFLGRGEIDLLDMRAAGAQISALQPAAIINTAAFTAVDQAESQPVMAALLNTDLPATLALLSSRLGIPFMHFSTDYVFAGNALQPRREDDTAMPASVYGQTKLAGEKAVETSGARSVILRSAGLFGRHGQNFLKSMILRSDNLRPIDMVSDQVHTPTPAAALARLTQQLAFDLIDGRELPAILHLTGQPATSWFDFTMHIFEHLHAAGRTALPALRPITLKDLPRPAPRPRFSALDCSLAASLGYAAPAWQPPLSQLVQALADRRIAA
jgi:dTDP-4-dehydrorhamnose reductase